MTREKTANTKPTGQLYQQIVTGAGLALWAVALVFLAATFTWRDRSFVLLLVPLAIFVGMFPQHFRLPYGGRFTEERLTFTLTDAIVLLVAVWFGLWAAVFVAGVEAFTSSRRTVKRRSSNLFSAAMMALAAACAAATVQATLRFGFGEAATGVGHTLLAISVALLVASMVQHVVNMFLLSALLALRHKQSVFGHWKENFMMTAPIMFLPTSAAACLIHITLLYEAWFMIVAGCPILLAVYFGQRFYSKGVQDRIVVMEKAHRETIEALAVTINAKDEVTHDHVLRVQVYSAGVAKLLGCTPHEVEALKAGALLHDIGKIAVPDYILNKPGKLTAAEFDKMKLHTVVGAQILSRVEFPYPVVPIVRSHHERWDGNGYPDGLKSEEIPLTARILSVVDCFDAVREDRQYRKAMSREEAVDFIMSGSGTMYDPRVVGTFITNLPQFEAQINAMRDAPVPNFGIEPLEELSEAARSVAPAAGLAESSAEEKRPTNSQPLTRTPKQIESARPQEFAHHELVALYELAQTVNAARNHDELILNFTEKLDRLVPFDSCAVTLTIPETGEHIVVHAAGRFAAQLVGRHIAAGEGVTGWVLANQAAFCNTDPKLDVPASLHEAFADYRTLAVFPVYKNTRTFGAVSLYSATLAEYTATQQRLIHEATELLAAVFSASAEPLEISNETGPLRWTTGKGVLKQMPLRATSPLTAPLKSDSELQSDLAH